LAPIVLLDKFKISEINHILKLVLVVAQYFTGHLQEDQQNKETDLHNNNNNNGFNYASVDQTCGGKTEPPVIPFELKGRGNKCAKFRFTNFSFYL
jgi:hypothetical protein